MKVGRRCLVTGRVQGVFFRASTRDRARALGVSGSARNRPDGRVEVEVFGDADSVAALCGWLWAGPPSARVEDVRCEEIPHREVAGFSTG